MHTRGQASTEYVAILLVVVALLALAPAVAVPGVGERVVATARTAICIVGGDVCRDSDAVAAGLEPCVTRARSTRQETSIDIAVVRLGEHGEWQLALQSDGGALVSRLDESEAGASAGIGMTFSPAGVDVSAGAAVVAGFHGGRAWRFPDARSATAFLDAAMREGRAHRARPADVRWHKLGGRAEGWATAAVRDLALADLTVSGVNAVGLRTDGPRRTITLDLGVDEPRLDLPGFPARGGAERALVADLTWEHGSLRELALRTAIARGDLLQELTARLDLRDPESRAVAARLLRPAASRLARLGALSARMRSHGVIELGGYLVRERRRGVDIATKLGVALGLSHHRIASERRLVDAVAWVRGGPPQRRFDCLGV